MKRNPHREMATLILGEDPVEFVRAKRAEGLTYQDIARELYTETDGKLNISFNTVGNWLKEEVAS